MTPNDAELLNRYRTQHSETAFAELVQRYLDLVYSAALRQVGGDVHLAKDVTQIVFADLALKAGGLTNHPSIAGWLYTSTRFAAAKAVRSEQRRRVREHTASTMQQLHAAPESEVNWDTLRPVLDDAMHELDEPDREAVLLRYFQGRDLRTVGSALGVSDDAARKRVERALDKLRGTLEQRGIRSTSSALASALAGIAISSAPSGLSGSIITASLAGSAAVGAGLGSALTHLMNATQMKTALVGAIALAALTTALIIEHNSKNRLVQELDQSRAQGRELETLRAENERLQKLEADAAELKRLRADQRELMRLRGEATTLRRRLAESTNANAPTNPLQQARSNLVHPSPTVRKFGGQASAKVPHGQTLITGGWPTAEGKRLLVMLTPQVLEGDGPTRQVLVQAELIEAPDAYFPEAGTEPTTDPSKPQMLGFLDQAQSQTMLSAFKTTEGYRVMSAPRVSTADGRQARLSIGTSMMIDGEAVNIGPTIDLVPRITVDGIDIELKAEVNHLDDAGQFARDTPPAEAGR